MRDQKAASRLPCLTYVEQLLGGAMYRGGCLDHDRCGPARHTEAEALADCKAHALAVARRRDAAAAHPQPA